MTQAKILFEDLEVSRQIVEGYGNKWEFKVVKILRHQFLMSYSYKWLGEKPIHFRHMHGYKDMKTFVQSLRDLEDEADIIIGHNLNRFDDKMGNRFYIEHGIDPPSPYKMIDTLQIARSVFKFPGNSLNDLAEFLGVGKKEKITYADIETDFIANPTVSIINKMKKYNNKDVELLEGIYLKMRPFIRNHPNLSVIGDSRACPKCGGKHLNYRGYAYTNTMKYHRVQCQDCRGWFRERVADKEEQNKPDYVN